MKNAKKLGIVIGSLLGLTNSACDQVVMPLNPNRNYRQHDERYQDERQSNMSHRRYYTEPDYEPFVGHPSYRRGHPGIYVSGGVDASGLYGGAYAYGFRHRERAKPYYIPGKDQEEVLARLNDNRDARYARIRTRPTRYGIQQDVDIRFDTGRRARELRTRR